MESPGVSRIAAEEAWESEVLPASEAAPAPAESEVAPASPEGEAVPEPAEERPSMLAAATEETIAAEAEEPEPVGASEVVPEVVEGEEGVVTEPVVASETMEREAPAEGAAMGTINDKLLAEIEEAKQGFRVEAPQVDESEVPVPEDPNVERIHRLPPEELVDARDVRSAASSCDGERRRICFPPMPVGGSSRARTGRL